MFPPVVAALLLLAGQSAPSQAKQVVPGQPSYATEADVIQQSDTVFRYNADGTGTEEIHVRAKVQNDAGVRAFAVLSAPYASRTQTAQVESITVTHADGTTTVTPPSDAMTLPAQVTQEAPLYSDLQVLQIPVRGLRPGDVIDYRMKVTQTSAEAPNQFWNSFIFLKSQVVLSQTVTLDVPEGKYVQAWSPDFKPVVTKSGGRAVYRWTNSQLKPTSSDSDKKEKPASEGERPDLAWTSFRTWQELGDWYHSLAAPQSVPNDAVRAQADALTQGAKTPEDQVKAIYTFVSTHIRYIGIDFGIGRYEPHPAAEVLANQYGDCKDKDTLLEALLHAKGFITAPALIGVGFDAVPDLPSPGQFNHVITTVQLPSGRIWLDATPEVAPYRLLVSAIRDKQALVIPASGAAALEKTPALPPYPFVDHFVATGTLKADGEFNAHVEIQDRSDAEILLRSIARVMAPAQWDRATQYLSALMGFSGTTSNSSFGHADDFSAPMQVSWDYSKSPYGDWDTFRILPPFPVVSLPGSPDKKPTDDFDLGAPRTETAIARISLPAGFSANLPNAVHVKTAFATIDQTYALENGVLTISRTVEVLQPKLAASSWQDYKKFLSDSSLDDYSWIQLTSTNASGAGPHPPAAGPDNPVAAELIREVGELQKARDWAAVKKKLDEAKAIEPAQPYLWSNYGYAAMSQGHFDEAEKDFAKELGLHPDETYVVLLDAGMLRFRHKNDEARAVLQASFDRDSSDERVAMALAALQAENSVPDAVATLQKASAAQPNNQDLATALAAYLIENHQNADAATLMKKVLDQAQDALQLNDASYELAETGIDLPLAEQKARQALKLLDQDSQADISSANAQSFQQASLLVATWDTLGYILLHENKLDEAREYLEAAWRNSPDLSVGLHYGDLLEKTGQKQEALRIDQLSSGGIVAPGANPDQQMLRDAIQRLKQEGFKTSIGDPSIDLQNARTFHITPKSPYSSFTSATFRLQLQAGGVRGVMRVSGDASLDAETDAVRKVALPALVPAHSAAYLLRDAVVTCSPGQKECELVLIPLSGIQAERAGN